MMDKVQKRSHSESLRTLVTILIHLWVPKSKEVINRLNKYEILTKDFELEVLVNSFVDCYLCFTMLILNKLIR
jgi:hypothetical protein